MLNRLFAAFFLLFILSLPFAALLATAGSGSHGGGFSAQKGLCYATGIGCGSGHSVLPALTLLKS
ncbi:MAG: sugar transporter [Rhodobacteraceae bacterium]|nr:sugar transporter [Paracoccaceae bacterium]